MGILPDPESKNFQIRFHSIPATFFTGSTASGRSQNFQGPLHTVCTRPNPTACTTMEYQSPWPNTPSTPHYQTPYENAYTSIASFEIDVHGSGADAGLAMYQEDGVSSSDFSEESNHRVLRSHSRAAGSSRLQEVDDRQPSVSSTTSYAAMMNGNNTDSSRREPVPALQMMAPPAPAYGLCPVCT